MIKQVLFVGLLIVAQSCNWNSSGKNTGMVARAGDDYLYVKDVKHLIPKGTSPEDSIQIIRSYAQGWASQKLVMSAAENNINDDQKLDIERLIEQYKTDLYTSSYIERLVSRSLDTLVTDQEVEMLYQETKDNFKLQSKLVKLRFLIIQKDHQDYQTIKARFFKYNAKDKEYIESKGIQFKQYALNEDVWVDSSTLFDKFPFLTTESENDLFQKGKSIEKTDDKNNYLIKVSDVLNSGTISPIAHQKQTLKDIILNRRKLKLITSLKKGIIDNAFKNEEFEIYK